MICPVVTYAPTAATKPNIAAQPLKRSASGVMIKLVNYMNYCNRVYEALLSNFLFFFRDFIIKKKICPFLAVLLQKCVKFNFYPVRLERINLS